MTESASKLSSRPNRWPITTTPKLLQVTFAILVIACLFSWNAQIVCAQNLRVTREQVTGTVTEVKPGTISIKSTDGETTAYLIQDKTDRAVVISGRPTRVPCNIRVVGEIPLDLIEQGMAVKLQCKLNGLGKTEADIDSVQLIVDEAAEPLQVERSTIPDSKKDFADATVVGRVLSYTSSRMQLEVPKSNWLRKGRISLKVTKQATLKIDDDSLARVVPGDQVEEANVLKLPSGEQVVESIKIKLTGDRKALTKKFSDQLKNKFSHLSDEPGPPHVARSPHFALHTDISQRQAQILLAKLETMYDLVSGYYRAHPRNTIECYVVRDLSQWTAEQIPPSAQAKIREPAGVTISRVSGRSVRAIVYSCDNQDVAQHEAVHAFCVQTFGSTGPTWYSEGMAEMGQYWKKGNLAVDISPYVANYLANAEPEKLADIVKLGQETGDSWQAYSWRCALCHLLASNPNYFKRFKQLGINLMKKRNDSFDQAFGPHADEISFEYDQFIENFGNGYRADLCVWDWKTKPVKLSGSRLVKAKVKAQAGWQATKALTLAGTSYSYEATGNWQFEPTGELDADGSAGGQGRLMGVIFKDFKLGEPFELGTEGVFVAKEDGQLYVRCQDDWTSLSDNSGSIQFQVQKTPKSK